MIPHPAKFSPEVMTALKMLTTALPDGTLIIDPFAGIGRIHDLGTRFTTVGIEIEPEWASQHPFTRLGDSTDQATWLAAIAYYSKKARSVITSPAYGNRMADSYLGSPKDFANGGPKGRRLTYAVSLMRLLSKNNGARMQWGDAYRELHEKVWRLAAVHLLPGEYLFLNIKDHYRKKKAQGVPAWHRTTLEEMGFEFLQEYVIPTKGYGQGQNREARLPELIMIFRRNESSL